MNVLLYGATGFSGKMILQELLSKQHKVTAITRKESTFPISHENLTVVEGSVLDSSFVYNVLKGQDAVINCLGIGGKGNAKPNTLVSDATRVLVEEMEHNSGKRLICMSNVGAGDSMNFQPWIFTKVILPYVLKWLKHIIDDKNIMEPIVMHSSLDWILFRFPNIVDKPPKQKITTTTTGEGLKMSITNRDLAVFMVEQLTDNTYLKQAICVSN